MPPLLHAVGIEKHYAAKAGFSLSGNARVEALRGVDLDIAEGEIVGLIGESGCGKSTLARVLALLEPATAGRIDWRGTEVTSAQGRGRRRLHREIQLILQDPYDSLDPRQTILQSVVEPLEIHGQGSRAERREAATQMLAEVGLTNARRILESYPRSLSGGERQRVSIARAMVLRPSLIIADEPLSMVDVSARADIVNLILRIRQDFGTAFVYVTHDIATARHLCSRISVMYAGRIVESGDSDMVLDRPSHPYSDLLRSAVPLADAVTTRRRVADGGEPPPATDIPTGCAFRTRCPRAQERCVVDDPALRALLPGVDVACHYPLTSDAPLLERTG